MNFLFFLMYGYTDFFIIFYSRATAQKRISLDEGWKFHFGNAADPAKDFNYSTLPFSQNQELPCHGDLARFQ